MDLNPRSAICTTCGIRVHDGVCWCKHNNNGNNTQRETE